MILSVIIPTCNRNEMLSDCLNLLIAEAQFTTVEYEIIVTDDSKDNSAKSLLSEKYSVVKWIEGPKKGPAANRNNGANKANGEWLVFLDDDCLPQKYWLASYIRAIGLSTTELVLEGCTDTDRPKQRFDEEAPVNLTGNKLWSCNFAIKRDFFFQLTGFDESFPFAAMEDIDFYTRIKALTSVKFVPDALVIHPWRRVKPFKNFQKHINSQKYFAKKYNLTGSFDFRLTRTKIFVAGLLTNFAELIRFSMRGWKFYLEKCALNFCMIFI